MANGELALPTLPGTSVSACFAEMWKDRHWFQCPQRQCQTMRQCRAAAHEKSRQREREQQCVSPVDLNVKHDYVK